MREMTLPESGSKRKLFDAAVQLFANKGFDAVSIRDITHAAGLNVASVNYHFGGQEGLLALVVRHYLTPLNEDRLVRLNAIDRKGAGKVLPLEEIVDAWVRPIIDQASNSGLSEELFYQLLGRIFAWHGDGVPLEIEASLQRVTARFTRALAKALPSLAGGDLNWLIHFLSGALIHGLTHQELLQRSAKEGGGGVETGSMFNHFIRFSIAVLGGSLEVGGTVSQGPQATFDF